MLELIVIGLWISLAIILIVICNWATTEEIKGSGLTAIQEYDLIAGLGGSSITPSRSGSTLDSALIAAVTDSTILGAVIGGDIVGAVIGDSLDGDIWD